MEECLQEKAEIATHILQGEWEAAHEKAILLLQKEPENIEFLVFVTMSSAYGGFFQDAVDYGKKALLWAENNGNDIAELNSIEMSVIDIQEFIAQSYFGLKDYSSAADELDKIRRTLGKLPDSMKQFAVKNENMMNGADAALHLAESLDAEFDDRTSEEFYEFKIFENQICFHEIITIADGVEFPENLRISKAQKMAGYLLRLVNCLEDVDENYLDENSKNALSFGKEWLMRVFAVLYRGDSKNGFEMEISHYYPAAKECIMVLDKLAGLGNGFAQKTLGDIYSAGYNVEQDGAKAFHFYKQAYENGENSAMLSLALYYDEGAVVEKDSNKALEYAHKAVEAGVKRADTVLGQIYADSFKDVEQGLVWLKKGYANGDKMAKNILLRLGRENVEEFDDKLQFILDTNKKLEKDIDALGTGYVTELGKKYARDYMEIEKYYIAPSERLTFISICLNVQVDLVTAPEGIVSGDFLIGQFEKLIAEDREMASRVAKTREMASRIQNLALVEMSELAAAGKLNDLNILNWSKIQKYYFPKALELGWDGYYADGSGPWKPDSSSTSSKSAETKNQSPKTGFAAMDTQEAYSNVPSSESKSGGCYIATAVYGSYDCPEVWTLRRFRDDSLAKSMRGRLFIRLYYTVSPTLVKLFGSTAWFQQFWRDRLDKIVKELQKKGYEDTPYCD